MKLKDLELVYKIAAGAVVSVVFLYSTFATIKMVEAKDKAHEDQQVIVILALKDIRDLLMTQGRCR